MPTQVVFQNGVKDPKGCAIELVRNTNCSQLCYPIIFGGVDDIPVCKNKQEMVCMINKAFWNATFEVQFGQCLKVKQFN